jgi:ABC-type transporter Mla subunit MlaD
MKQTLRWRDLAIGLIGIAGIVGATIAILLFARVGGVRGAKDRLYVTAASARGVLRGTEVMIAGKRVGTVNTVHFLPPSGDTLARLLIEAEVLRSSFHLLRRNSYAEIRPSGTIIGAPVVDITLGGGESERIAAGDTIRALPQVAAERFVDRAEALTDEVSGAFREWRSVMANVRSAGGTFGAMRVRGPQDLATFRALSASLMRRLDSYDGTVALTFRDEALRVRMRNVASKADSIAALLDSDRGSVGRFRRDSTLIRELEVTRAELARITGALDSASGTMGRGRQDRALQNEIAGLKAQVEQLTEDVKRNPARYLVF